MVERGVWSLCKTFDLFQDQVDFAEATDYTLVYDLSEKIPSGTYPFNTLLRIYNSSTQDINVKVNDDDVELAEVVVAAGKTGVLSVPPVVKLLVYTKGGAGTLKIRAFLATVASSA